MYSNLFLFSVSNRCKSSKGLSEYMAAMMISSYRPASLSRRHVSSNATGKVTAPLWPQLLIGLSNLLSATRARKREQHGQQNKATSHLEGGQSCLLSLVGP